MTRREYYQTFEPTRFTRAWWLARLRSAAWVAIVTLLVWIYADAEFTDEMDLSATLNLSAARPDQFVLLSKNRVRVTFKAQGRRSSLELLERWLRRTGTVIRYNVADGRSTLDVRDVLNRERGIQKEGITVLSARPAVVRVRLDRKIHRPDIPVKLEYTGAFPSEITITPPTMGIHVAGSDWEEILKAEPNPVLRTVSVELKGVQDDKPFLAQIVRQIAGVTVEPDQPTVTVRARIAQLTETEVLSVPVQMISPTSWMEDGTWKEYVLKRRDAMEWRPKIQVSGTRKDLDQLTPGDVKAYVVLTDGDKEPVSWLTRQVEIRLPRDLNLKLLGTRPSVSFKLEKLTPVPTP